VAGFHTIKQGEHVTRLACDYGFADYQSVWDDPQNSDLKALRQNPNVLFPGDLLYIPDRMVNEETRPTDQKHQFQMKQPKLRLRLNLEASYDSPLAGLECQLAIENDLSTATTGGARQVDEPIPPRSERVKLVVPDDKIPVANPLVFLQVGHLDPVTELSGQLARLKNLGYYTGSVGGGNAQEVRSALEEFQCDEGLELDGICGTETQGRLVLVHGC
jgi:hypothetical protein